jgi:hypothetical protein
MSEGTAATTLSATSSNPVYTRSSIGNASTSRRDSLSAASTTSSTRPPRNSLSRQDSVNSSKLTAMARMEQRGGTSTAATDPLTMSSLTGLSDTNQSQSDMRHSHYKEGIRLAEMGDWPVLVRRLPREPQLARHKDHHGMLPLHWACTEDDAGPAVVRALLEAFPEGVITRNNAQYLPIHIAVRAGLPNETIQLLCDARPSSLLEETPAGKTPLQLAVEAGLSPVTVNLLRRAQHAYDDPSEDNDDDRDIEDAKRAIEVQSHLLRESMMMDFGSQRAAAGRSNSTVHSASTLSVGRLQSHSVLGAFPSEARSSAAWADRRGTASFVAPSTSTSTRSLPVMQSVSSSVSTSSSVTNTNQTVVRYMDTLMRDKPVAGANDFMIDEDGEMMGRYTTDEGFLPPRSFIVPPTGSQSLGGTLASSSDVLPPTRAPPTRNTEGDLASFSSGVCGVCYKKFGVFRKKYQCKSCWMAVCKKHVANKIELPGHKKKRSVCADCNILHMDTGAAPVLPSVPGHSGGNPAPGFPHTHPGTYSIVNPQAIVPTRSTRADSHKSGGSAFSRGSVLSNGSELRPTGGVPRTTSSVRFAPTPTHSETTSTTTTNSMALVQKPLPQRPAERFGSDTTASLTETDRNSSEATTALHQRVATLEEQNKVLLSRLADQEKQYDDCMLLLTQTMTRVAEIEMRMPGLKFTNTGSERESEGESNPASFDFGYPMSGAYNTYAIK